MTVAGLLRSPLQDIEPVRPEHEQGPVPEHLRPAAKAPRVSASPARSLPDRSLGGFPAREELAPAPKVTAAFGEPAEAVPLVEPPAGRKPNRKVENTKRWRARRRGELPPPDFSAIRAAASAMGRKGGKIGAARFMEATTPEQRRELARHAAESRWKSRPPEEVQGRPNCEACGHLATPRGKSADGLRWKCLPCGRSWSTVAPAPPLSLEHGGEVAIGGLGFRVLAYAGAVLVLEKLDRQEGQG